MMRKKIRENINYSDDFSLKLIIFKKSIYKISIHFAKLDYYLVNQIFLFETTIDLVRICLCLDK